MLQHLLAGEVPKSFYRNSKIEYRLTSFHLHRLRFPSLAAQRSPGAPTGIVATSAQRTPVAEAERLIGEQLRLLEAEREESLAIARSCTARSKRLLARLDNLKTYNRSTVARRTSIAPSTPSPPGSSSTSYLDAQSQRTPTSTAPQPVTSQPTESQRQRASPGARSPRNNAPAGIQDLSQSTFSLEPRSSSDAQEAQTRRLVSRALQRNIARGENNMALAEKLQVYIDVLRDELARVRRGDVALAVKLLDEHRARMALTASGPQPPPQLDPDSEPSRPNSLGRYRASDDTISSSGANDGGNNDSTSTASRTTAPGRSTPDDTVVVSGSLASGALGHPPSSSTALSAVNHRLIRASGPNSFNSSNGPADANVPNGASDNAATIPSGHDDVDSNPTPASSSDAESGDCGATGDEEVYTQADIAGGLGRIFSRTALLTLPGDPVGGGAVVGAAAGSSGQGEWEDDVTLRTAAVTVGSGRSQEPVRPQAADEPAARPDVGNSSQDVDDNPGTGELSSRSSNGINDVGAVSSASNASSAGDRPGLGLSLSDARSLAYDSEAARKALLGLLQPSGHLAGPLEGFVLGRKGGGSTASGSGIVSPTQSPTTGPSDEELGGPEATKEEEKEEVEATVKEAARFSVYALAGDQIPHRATDIAGSSAADAAAVAVAAAAAAAAAEAAAQAVGNSGGNGDGAAGDVRQVVLTLSIMVLELRRRGYVGCDEVMEATVRALEAGLAAARASAAAARVNRKA